MVYLTTYEIGDLCAECQMEPPEHRSVLCTYCAEELVCLFQD